MTVAVRKRPRVDFTQKERATELALMRDLKDAQKFAGLYPLRLKEAEDNLSELYELVEKRYRNEK